jgi:regulatory protein
MPIPKPRLLDRAALWEYAVRALGSRAHSTGELQRKLARRAEHAEDIAGVLAQLKEYGYLNDQRFAESFATSRLENQRLGRSRVVRDLRQRHVDPATTERTVDHVYQDVDESALIEEWIRRKYRTAPRDGLFQEERDLASAYRRLLHAGFRSGNIVQVLKRFAKNPELLDNFEPPEEPMEDE